MKQKKTHWLWRVLCVLWLALIFSQSLLPSDASAEESSSILSYLVGLFPCLTEHLLRKLAHFSEFAILGFFLSQSLRRHPIHALPAGLVCALCDETIQLFVPGRSGQLSDVWLDFSGVTTAVLLCLLIRRLRKRAAHHV